jgi:acrylyl-CoA reductase (NADPH)
VWNEVSKIINFELLEKSIKTIGLEELIETYSKMLNGETSGRYIVDVNK